MSQMIRRMEEMIYSGDEEVRTWFLVGNNYMPFILCSFYVLFSLRIGPALMKNRKPFDLRIPMAIFNFGLVFIYVISISIIIWNLPKVTMKEFCVEGSVKKGTINYTIIRHFWVIYLLKYVEHLDTVFFILRKKESLVTFLHVFHHAIMPILMWIVFRTEKSAILSMPGLLNSTVHVVMYSYYGLAAMGPEWRKYLFWKKYLTQFQMGQFILITLYAAMLPISGCTIMRTSYWMCVVIAPLFLYLFYRFYVSAFRPKQKSRITNKSTMKDESKNGVANTETSRKGD